MFPSEGFAFPEPELWDHLATRHTALLFAAHTLWFAFSNPGGSSSLIPPPSSLQSCPFEGAFAPRVIITDYENADENEHLDQREFGKRKIIAHKNDRPGQQEDRLDIENQKQHRHDVVTHRKAFMRARFRIDAALIRPHLVLLIFQRPQKPPKDERQDRERHRKHEKDHHRQIRRRWST